jgi:type II secretory pathway predicted ATPase ExeA
MSYEHFYDLKEQPFSNAPDGRFYFKSPSHEEAMVRIFHVVETMKGLAVMIGSLGTGKTMVARRMIEKLDTEEYESALLVILHREMSAEGFLKRIALQFEIDSPAEEKVTLVAQIYQRLEEIYEQGRKAVILIDEANMLQSAEIMEEIRGLLNLEIPGRKLISIILMGTEEIEKTLALNPALAQRVALKFTLKPLDEESTYTYIKHRLEVAGTKKDLFTQQALSLIFKYSKGLPRLINTICDNALLEGFLIKKNLVDEEIIESVVRNLGLEKGGE